MNDWLKNFVEESNRIEGILREPTLEEIKAHETFLNVDVLRVGDLEALVSVLQPDAILRDRPSVPGVRVGNHIAPASGHHIRDRLKNILHLAPCRLPFDTHRDYENLHPFTDGNGRSGRALWLTTLSGGELFRAKSLGFLHTWYYQSLDASR
jgi:hypothetical protein